MIASTFAAVVVALVVQDQAPLRASAHENAQRQTALAAGDWLEVRGEQKGYLQVYDHRRERPGYVRPAAVRSYTVEESTAPRLGVLVDYLKDAPGSESLGIGYAALYMRAAPAQYVGAEVLDALGTMAERLGRRASARVSNAGDAALAGQVEAAESYGVKFVRFEREGRTRVCYDGEAYRRVLALGGSGPQRVRAALGLTDPACADPATPPSAALANAKWRAGVLEGVDPSKLGDDVPVHERAHLRLRRSVVDADLAYFAARTGDPALAKSAAESADRELRLVDRATIVDEDRLAYDEAAVRVATVRWAEEDASPKRSSGALDVEIAAGEPGQTCIKVMKRASSPMVLATHCTYALVWPSSVRIAPHDAAVTLVTAPLAGWNELVVLHAGAAGWTTDVVDPASIDPDLGYVELAGVSPDGAHLLVAKEARETGPVGAPNTLAPWIQRAFQVVATADLHVEKSGTTLANFPTFKRWESVEWARGTLALR